jgi:hypothetical protein
MCDFCSWAIKLRCWYFNPTRDKWVKLFARGWSSLLHGDVLICPTIGGERTEGKDTFPIVSALATREQMRGWLTNPPEPPFTIAIAESGQKHILPWAQEGHDREYFPVQFELDSLWIDRAQFTSILDAYESLMGLGFSKTEITSGQYHSDRLMAAWDQYEQFDVVLETYRGSRLIGLVAHVAQKIAEPTVKNSDAEEAPVGQLNLF